MPGYEPDRFVNLSQNDKADLSCSICQGIFCSPLVAQCCQQLFCEDCINDWLKENNTCPYDRKPMTLSELSRPSRVILKMLGKLKIHCDFKANGCKEIVLLEDLFQHTDQCLFIVGKCKKCLCDTPDKSIHDCIKTLLELNRKVNKDNETLKSKMNKTNALTIQELSQRLRNGKIRREIKIIKTDMKENMISDVKKITFEAIEKSNSLTDISSELMTQMDNKFWGKWQCFIFAHFGTFSIRPKAHRYIYLTIDCLKVVLFQ